MKSLRKNIFREIWQTKSRFISILAIIALSIGFFSGIKSSAPSLIKTADDYFINNNLMDFRLVSTVGFDDEDITAIENADDVLQVMPSYMADVITKIDNYDSVVRVYSVPKTENGTPINKPNVVEGRLPQNSGECVIENTSYGSGSLDIGDTLEILPTVGNKDTSTYLKKINFKIVGKVESPLYITFQHGNTTVGDGTVSLFAMIPAEDFAYEKYTELYVKTEASSSGYSAVSDEYKNMIKDETAVFENLSKDAAERFNSGTLADAKKKLDDAKKEYADKKAEAEKQLADSKKKLDDGQKEFDDKIAAAEKEIKDNEQTLKDGKAELEASKKTYEEQIAAAEKKLKDGEAELEKGKKEYQNGLDKYNKEIKAAQQKIDAANSEYQKEYNKFTYETKPEAQEKLNDAKEQLDNLDTLLTIANGSLDIFKKIPEKYLTNSQKQKIKELEAKISEYQKQYNEGLAQYEAGKKQLADGEKQLAEAKQKLDSAQKELDIKSGESKATLDEAKDKLTNAENQLNEGKLELQVQKLSAELKFKEAEQKITDGEEKLAAGKAELETQKTEGQKKLDDGKSEYEAGKKEAEEKLAEGEEKIKDAEDKIADIPKYKWYVYDREDNKGYSGLNEDAERVNSVAVVFPVFFLIVAVLVCITTMTRLVEERRTEIGTLKALGYSPLAIIMKYFLYAATAAVLGSIIGSLIGIATLPKIIVETYGILYTLPEMHLSVDYGVVLISSAVAIIATCAVAVFTCIKELKMNAATLMRPKAPKPGKRILLEKIPFIWKHMNFTSKVTARNLFRYKARFLMTVIGVAGCTALIVAGFGLKASISTIAGKQFGDITKYDAVMALKESQRYEKCKPLIDEMNSDKNLSTVLATNTSNTKAYTDSSKKQLELSYIIPQNNEDFKKVIDLRTRVQKTPVELTDKGVVVTERMADILDIGIGDKFTMLISDDPYEVEITGITENYAGNYIYMTPNYYEKITGNNARYNTVYVQINNTNSELENSIATKWMKNDDIITISFISDSIASVDDMLKSLNVIVLVLIICAGALATVVLYNLTNINIAERVREIATIKVLGFYNGETAAYIYRENIVLTIVGAIVGLLLGSVFTKFIVETIQMDMVMFSKENNPMSFVWGFVLTAVFSAIVNIIMYRKMKKIDMVESLKSVE